MRWYAIQAAGIVIALALILAAWSALGYVDVVVLGAIGAVVAWESGRLALVGYHGTGPGPGCPQCGSSTSASADRCTRCGYWFRPHAAGILRHSRHRRKSA